MVAVTSLAVQVIVAVLQDFAILIDSSIAIDLMISIWLTLNYPNQYSMGHLTMFVQHLRAPLAPLTVYYPPLEH